MRAAPLPNSSPRVDVDVYQNNFNCGDPKSHSIQTNLDEIKTLGIIFNQQAGAAAVINHIRQQISDVEKRVAGLPTVRTLYFDAYSAKPLYTVPCCINQDVVSRAGGTLLFAGTNVDGAVSPELVAASGAEAVLALNYGTGSDSVDHTQFLPAFEQVIANTPAGKANRPITPIKNYFAMTIRDGDHVEAVAHAIHPEAFKWR